MAYEKRKRSANWLPSEKTLLVDLVTEHFNIVENKKTDGVTMKRKLAAWATISESYNSQTIHCHRTADNLKAQWESLKKSTKKEANSKRMHLIQTGAGPLELKIEDPLQERILCLISQSATGLKNPYDNDNSTTLESLPGGALVNGTILEPVVTTKPSNGSTASSASPAVEDSSWDWSDNSQKALSKRRKQTNPEEKRKPVNLRNRVEWMSTRRPQPASPSLENVHLLKRKAFLLQMEHASNEREEAKKLFDVQIDIQKEILKQEKIKTRLLILELRRNKKKK